MLQLKYPAAIKLFGQTIPFCGDASCSDNDRDSSAGSEIGAAEKVSEVQAVKVHEQQGEDEPVKERVKLKTDENRKTSYVTDETVNTDNRSSDVNMDANLKEKTSLKKPDKVLECPRCESMDTKFCYYNNYNVLQPRHFCKVCQRYWTAGGAMRNVPVGAGRRKSKNSSVQNRYLTISEVLQASGAGSPNGMAHSPQVLNYGSVLTVGSDAAVCASTGSVSNLKEISFLDGARNLAHKAHEQVVIKSHEVGDINSSGSCITASNEIESKIHSNASFAPSLNACLAQLPCIPGMQYPWNAAIPPPAFPHPGFALPFIHPNYWPCAPWLTPQSLSQTNTDVNVNPISKPPVLGKHSRDGEMLPKDMLEEESASVLRPKTLRIDHPEEALRSSIWETLGIQNETVSKGGFLTELKSDETKLAPENYAHLSSNPAALSRSLNFQEEC
ncbi:unnamed protein product [Rhodiola kirilowii]